MSVAFFKLNPAPFAAERTYGQTAVKGGDGNGD